MTGPVGSQVLMTAEKVSKTFRLGTAQVHALRQVSLEVSAGEMLCLTGRSGSGKTTLLNILGLIEDADEGRLSWKGRDVLTLSDAEKADLRARTLGFVFQTFNLIPVLTAWENVEYPMLLVGADAAKRKARVEELLLAVGLQAHSRHRPDELSGGQRQRVAIARALANRPPVVLADELTSALDRNTSIEIMELIRDLNRGSGTTFVFSSHDELVTRYCGRVVSLSDGILAPPEAP